MKKKRKNKEGMEVLYKQAKRDAFNRAIYVLYKNWKNYDNNHKKNGWPKIEWKNEWGKYDDTPTWMNTTAYGGRKKRGKGVKRDVEKRQGESVKSGVEKRQEKGGVEQEEKDKYILNI